MQELEIALESKNVSLAAEIEKSDTTNMSRLFNIRTKCPKNVIISYLNINSIRNKLNSLDTLLNGKVDVLIVAESKLDSSFPDRQFIMKGYKKPFRLDIHEKSGGLLVYVNENTPSSILNEFTFDSEIQVVPFELNLRKQKWIIFSIYRPPKQSLKYFLSILSSSIDFYTRSYGNVIVIGDFNAEPRDPVLDCFMKTHGLYNHMKTKTCWKSSNGTCIDLILSNKKFSFQNTGAVVDAS